MSLRSLVDKANELGIRKEQIVNVLHFGEMFSLIYYKDSEEGA